MTHVNTQVNLAEAVNAVMSGDQVGLSARTGFRISPSEGGVVLSQNDTSIILDLNEFAGLFALMTSLDELATSLPPAGEPPIDTPQAGV